MPRFTKNVKIGRFNALTPNVIGKSMRVEIGMWAQNLDKC